METIVQKFMSPKSLSPKQQEEMQDEFWNWFCVNREQDVLVLESLKSYFHSSSPTYDIQFLNTYIFWFTMLFWKYFNQQSEEDIIQFFPRLFPMAAFSGEQVKGALFSYMQLILTLPEKVEPFYQDICDALLVSQAVIGTKENASYSVQKFVKEVLEGKQMTKGSAMLWYNDHVEVATLFDQEIYTQDLLIAVDEIVEMIAFCLVVPKNFVWNYVDTYGRPEEIQYRTLHNMLGSPLELEDSFKAFNDTLLRSTPKPNVAKQSDIEKTSDTDFIPNDVLLGTTESLRSTLEWLKGFESPKLAWNALQERIKEQVVSLDFESANAIMQLSFFLKQNGYADQPDIVYYDQSSNNFHWNQ